MKSFRSPLEKSESMEALILSWKRKYVMHPHLILWKFLGKSSDCLAF